VIASVDLDHSTRGKKDARRVSVPAGLNLISRTWEIEDDTAQPCALNGDVRTVVQWPALDDINNKGV
jgi:hypothetical protein